MKKRLSYFLAFSLIAGSILQTLPTFANGTGIETPKFEKKEDYKMLEDFLKTQTIGKLETKRTFVVEIEPQKRSEALKKIKQINGAEIKYEYSYLFSGASIAIPITSLEELRSIDGVLHIEENNHLKPQMINAEKLAGVIAARENEKFKNRKNLDGRGMLIAVVDSGMDIHHKSMRLDDDVKDSDLKVKDIDTKHGFTRKVPFGYNYVDGNYNLKDNTNAPHGQHIAGTLVANDTDEDIKNKNGFDGIAPNAQLLMYKIFTYEEIKDEIWKLSGDDAVYHALEDAAKRGADVISLSYGAFGTGSAGDIYYNVCKKLKDMGIVVTAAMGNVSGSGSSTSYDDFSTNELGIKDTSAIVANAAMESVIGVGSAQNTVVKDYFNAVKFDDMKVPYAKIGVKELPKSKVYDFIYVNYGTDDDIKDLDLKGKIAVTLRGRDNVFEKVNRLYDHGAIGVIMANANVMRNRDYYMDQLVFGFEKIKTTKGWAAGISGKAGLQLIEKIKNNGKIHLEFTNEKMDNILKGETSPSGYTAWGPNVNLELKPDVIAPGENIVSTGNDNSYFIMSGTSMASPFTAGVSTILLPKVREDMFKHTGLKPFELVKIILQNTADVLHDLGSKYNDSYIEASPRQQGAGSINMNKALESDVLLTFKNDEGVKRGAVSLKEINGSKTFKVNLQNLTDKKQEFKIHFSEILGETTKKVEKFDEFGHKAPVNETHSKIMDGAKIYCNIDKIELSPKESKDVTFTISVEGNKNEFVEGFIYFTTLTENNPSLSIPFMGFNGSWSEERILDAPNWDKDSRTFLNGVFSSTTVGQSAVANAKKEEFFEVGKIDKKDKRANPDMISFNPDRAGSYVLPRIIPLRDATDYDVSIVTKNNSGNDNVLQVLRHGDFYKKFLYANYVEQDWYRDIVEVPDVGLLWLGKEFSKYGLHYGKEDFKDLPEGQYYYRMRFRNNKNSDYQTTYYPVKIDKTNPTINDIKLEGDKIIIEATDNVGIWTVKAKIDEKEQFVTKSQDGKYVIENVKLNPRTKNKLVVNVMDFALNKDFKEKDLKDKVDFNFRNLEDVKKGNSNILFIDSEDSDLDIAAVSDGTSLDVTNYTKNGKTTYKIEMPNVDENSKKDVEIKILKGGNVIHNETISIANDKEAPNISFDKKLKSKKSEDRFIFMVPFDKSGKFKIKGTLKDNMPTSECKVLFVKDAYIATPRNRKRHEKKVFVSNDGSFEIVGNVADYKKKSSEGYDAIYVYAEDGAGNVSNNANRLVYRFEFGTHFGKVEHDGDEGFIIANFNYSRMNSENIAEDHKTASYDASTKELTYYVHGWAKAGYKIEVRSTNPTYNGIKDYLDEKSSDVDGDFSIPVKVGFGYNSINVVVKNSDGKVELDRGYIFMADLTDPILTLDNEGYPIENFVPQSQIEIVGDGARDRVTQATKVLFVNSENPTITGKCSDDTFSWALRINGNSVMVHDRWGEFGDNELPFSYIANVKNNGILHISLTDGVGNDVSETFKVMVDKIAPEISLTSNGTIVNDGNSLNEDSTLDFTAHDDVKIKEKKLLVNGKEYIPNTPLKHYKNSTDGYYILASAKDLANNETIKELKIGKIPEVNVSISKQTIKKSELKTLDLMTLFEKDSLIEIEIKNEDSFKKSDEGKAILNIVAKNEYGIQKEYSFEVEIIDDTPLILDILDSAKENAKKILSSKDNFEKDSIEKLENTLRKIESTQFTKQKDVDNAFIELIKIIKSMKEIGKENPPVDPIIPKPEHNIVEPNSFPNAIKEYNPFISLYNQRLDIQFGQVENKKIDSIKKNEEKKKSEKNSRISVEYKGSYINGYFDGTFKPDKNITRAEFAAILSRILKLSTDENVSTMWYDKFIKAVEKEGLMKGYENGDFKPDKNITRAEVAFVIDKLTSENITEKNPAKFSDIENSFAKEAIINASKRGLIFGYEDGLFKPEKEITRAELVVIVNRILGREKSENYSTFKDVSKKHWASKEIDAASK